MSELLPDNNSFKSKTSEIKIINSKLTENPQQVKWKIAKWRVIIALGVAIMADSIGLILGEYFVVVFDVFVALVLIAILGFNWIFIPALLIECIPGLGLFPSWILAVSAILKWQK